MKPASDPFFSRLNIQRLRMPSQDSFMSSYKQRVQACDKQYQYLLFAAEPYEIIAFEIPSTEIGKVANKFFTHWDPDSKMFTLQEMMKAAAAPVNGVPAPPAGAPPARLPPPPGGAGSDAPAGPPLPLGPPLHGAPGQIGTPPPSMNGPPRYPPPPGAFPPIPSPPQLLGGPGPGPPRRFPQGPPLPPMGFTPLM